jgi:hypothetical protein
LASKVQVRQAGSLARLILQPRVFDDMPGELSTLVFDGKSSSLLRRELEKRSGHGFLIDMHHELCSLGFAPDIANGYVVAAVNDPNVAFIRREASAISVLHAVTMHSRKAGPSDAMLVAVRTAIPVG